MMGRSCRPGTAAHNSIAGSSNHHFPSELTRFELEVLVVAEGKRWLLLRVSRGLAGRAVTRSWASGGRGLARRGPLRRGLARRLRSRPRGFGVALRAGAFGRASPDRAGLAPAAFAGALRAALGRAAAGSAVAAGSGAAATGSTTGATTGTASTGGDVNATDGSSARYRAAGCSSARSGCVAYG